MKMGVVHFNFINDLGEEKKVILMRALVEMIEVIKVEEHKKIKK